MTDQTLPEDLQDTQWSDQARQALQQQAAAAITAIQEFTDYLAACPDEDALDVEEALERSQQLRAALLAYDDAGFDLSGMFPVCLPDEGDVDDDDLDLDEEDDEDDYDDLDLGDDEDQPEARFVTLVARCDYQITGLEGDLQQVVESLMGKDLVPIEGLQEVRKAMVHIPMVALEPDEVFDEDPFGLLLDD
ncbi:hypothetical protein AAEX63_12890 [Luteococcus sp. H138]|uniref:hypothetical protein n=1 Tax=unclassified Luteococcus TaxID=2639923 RepID=UPI00313B3B24